MTKEEIIKKAYVELIEVVGINAEEGETFEQWNKFLLGFLQNAVVEVHPAHVAFYVCFFNNFFFGHNLLGRYCFMILCMIIKQVSERILGFYLLSLRFLGIFLNLRFLGLL